MSHLLCSRDTRTHVVGELYDTERSYVESLQILVEKYMKPLKSLESNRLLIDSNLVDEIFYSIPEILQHHETFLSALQDRLSSDWNSSQIIGNVFIEAFTNQQIIDDYTAFINNWKNARQAIKIATQAKPAFERFLEAMSREHRNKLTLDALLIMPVQRIPRYELLIKELIKHTPEDHPDHEPLIEAQTKIHELALKIDRAEKEMIHQEQLKDLEALIEGHVELQHHQRDFIRYDLVTIVSASALAATKKERVLFLFCDLLIMTSIKKKASRRSNLQNAFANSSNDLSLLEGNKFKLLLRVPLDQVEIRLDYDQIQMHQQQQEEQQYFHLQRQNKLIQERRREIEADLKILQQMELLTANLSNVHRLKLEDIINELLNDMKQILISIEHNDMQMLNDEQHSTLSQYSTQELYLTPSPASISSSTPNQAPQASQSNLIVQGLSMSPAVSQHHLMNLTPSSGSSSNHHHHHQQQQQHHHHQHHHHHQQDSNLSLEFSISSSTSNNNNNNTTTSTNNGNNGIASKESHAFLTIDNQGYSIGGANQSSAGSDSLQPSSQANCESLVVTFSSSERRQAFIQAFIEAKQQRYQQMQQQKQQQQQQQLGKIFSSSVTLKLAQPVAAPPTTPTTTSATASATTEHRLSAQDSKLLLLDQLQLQQQQHHHHHCQEGLNAHLISHSCVKNPSGQVPASPLTADIAAALAREAKQPAAAAAASAAPCGSVIVHQMSAPQSLALMESAAEERFASSPQCTSCSYNLVAEAEKAHERNRQHHHHQLMHQPASHPPSLDTICCHDPHNDWSECREIINELASEGADPASLEGHHLGRQLSRQYADCNESMSRQLGLNSVVNLNSDLAAACIEAPTAAATARRLLGYEDQEQQQMQEQQQQQQQQQHQAQLIDQMNLNLFLSKCAPRFLVTLPVDFLNTQHPALQFTCSALGKNNQQLTKMAEPKSNGTNSDGNNNNNNSIIIKNKNCHQTVRDNLGQLWLCMSNGYVSHVALISLRKRELKRVTVGDSGGVGGGLQQPEFCGYGGGHSAGGRNCYSITPVVISAGDICKSHINCAAQVKWTKQSLGNHNNNNSRELDRDSSPPLITTAATNNESERPPPPEAAEATPTAARPAELEGKHPVEVAITSNSPPIDIKCKNTAPTSAQGSEDPKMLLLRLSESAPSRSCIIMDSHEAAANAGGARERINPSSSSTTKLEVPLHGKRSAAANLRPRSGTAFGTQRAAWPPIMLARPGSVELKRSIHDEICHWPCHLTKAKYLNGRTNRATSLNDTSEIQQIPNTTSVKYHPLHHHHHHHHNHHSRHHQPHHQHHPHHHHHLHHHPHHPYHGRHHHYHHHHYHHHNHHANAQHSRANHPDSHHRVGPGHSHSHHHHHHHSEHPYLAYGSRHNTVPIADLRRALERQSRIEQPHVGCNLVQQQPAAAIGTSPIPSATDLAAPGVKNSPTHSQKSELNSALDLAGQRSASTTPKEPRPTTPSSLPGMKGFRSARLLRHQASLKTSSMLAKLVGGASKRASYMRRSTPTRDRSSDMDDNDTDTDSGVPLLAASPSQGANNATKISEHGADDYGGHVGKNLMASLTMSASGKCASKCSQLNPAAAAAPKATNNTSVISPLSSASSLNSTNSSFTVNSACASSPNRGSCELLAHSYSATCCMGGDANGGLSMTPPGEELDSCRTALEVCGHRRRSATAPSRPQCGLFGVAADCEILTHHRSFAIVEDSVKASGRAYKVSEILNDTKQSNDNDGDDDSRRVHEQGANIAKPTQTVGGGGGGTFAGAAAADEMSSSLWLGCDDGSLIIIDCLTTNDNSSSSATAAAATLDNLDSLHELSQRTFTCGNVHSEIKLSSPICDISTYKEERVFVALSNGQLAVFSRNEESQGIGIWSLTKPEIVTVTENELNSIARLCPIDDNFIWYSYGRSIFVLNSLTLKLETTIMAPTNDLALRLTVQAITIDNMELMESLSGVWVSFKNSHLIQFYDIRSYKLLVELNLFEPINKLLSYGNEIIRQHKTACLKATSLLNYYNKREQCNTLFIGTSAGIILYLTITTEQLASRESIVDWKPQIASLRHGHSGHVKLLRLIEMDSDEPSVQQQQQQQLQQNTQQQSPDGEQQPGESHSSELGAADSNASSSNSNLYLMSGGTGLDIYGPSGEQQSFLSQLNSEEDGLNHLMIWQL